MNLVTHVSRVTGSFHKREVYRLKDQSRRAAASVSGNIAEGQANYSKAEFVHFLRHACGSLAELETQILLAERLEYTDRTQSETLLKQIVEMGKLLNGLNNSLKK